MLNINKLIKYYTSAVTIAAATVYNVTYYRYLIIYLL